MRRRGWLFWLVVIWLAVVAIAFVSQRLISPAEDESEKRDGSAASARAIDDRKIAKALGMRFEGRALVYELDSGDECRVIDIPQTRIDFERELESAAPDSIATTPDGGAGVVFAVPPFGSATLAECVESAESDLAALADER